MNLQKRIEKLTMTCKNNNHTWQYDEWGYAHCTKCGCVSYHHRCIICHKEYSGFLTGILEEGRLRLCCSRECLLQYLKPINTKGDSIMTEKPHTPKIRKTKSKLPLLDVVEKI